MAKEKEATEEVVEQTDAPELEPVIEEGEAQAIAPPAIEDIARGYGWKPKEEWSGKGEWRDAAEFVKYGLDSGRDVSQELKKLQKTTERMADTQARIIAETTERARQEERQRWEQVHAKAVEDGDYEKAREAVRGIAATTAAPRNDAITTFASENPWFNTDHAARAVAIAESDRLAHLPVSEQLEAAKQAVMKRFPEYAPKAAEPAKAIEVANPASTARPAKKGKSFSDLPADAQYAARELVRRGILKNTDGYVKHYFNQGDAA